ncbi:hypothetical protein [Methylocystis sp. S23]
MGERIPVPELVRLALLDAADWQNSLADAWPHGSPQRQEALNLKAQYMRLHNRRYGKRKDPFENAEYVTLEELRERAEATRSPGLKSGEGE